MMARLKQSEREKAKLQKQLEDSLTNVQTAKKTAVAPNGAKQFDTRRTKETPKPLRLLLTTVVSIFVVEAFVMFLLSVLPPLSPGAEWLLDAFMLTVLVFPALYFSSFQPMVLHVSMYKQSQEALRQAYDNMEQQVAERTAELKETNEALRQAEEKYRSIFENAVEGIYQTTLDGRYLTANPTLARIYGYESPEELIEAVSDLNRQFYAEPGRREEFIRLIEKEGRALEFQSRVYCKDGSVIWISESARAVRDAGGRLIGFEGTTIDISERKRMEETLKRSEMQLSVAQEVASLGSWDADLASNTVTWSPQLYRLLDIDPQECAASLEAFIESIHPDDQEKANRTIEQSLRDNKSFEFEHRRICRDGALRYLWAKGFINRDESGRPTRVFGIEQDITERKRAEEEREKMMLELQDALANVKSLSGLLPICASCKKIRDDKGYWNQIEGYIMTHSEATFSHGVCPECAQKLYPDYFKK